MAWLAWFLLIALSLLGFVGIFLPGLPGTALILAGAVFHKLILPEYLSWWVIAGIAALALIGWILEFVGLLLG